MVKEDRPDHWADGPIKDWKIPMSSERMIREMYMLANGLKDPKTFLYQRKELVLDFAGFVHGILERAFPQTLAKGEDQVY